MRERRVVGYLQDDAVSLDDWWCLSLPGIFDVQIDHAILRKNFQLSLENPGFENAV